MSRSVHTRPRAIRAADRLRDPRRPRGAGDPSRARRALRQLKELGISAVPSDAEQRSSWRLPSITEKRPRPGHHHPATRTDVAETLRFFGEECAYGVRAIELRQGTSGVPGLELGRLMVPGRIVLYDQPVSSWRLPGRISEQERHRLLDAGAEIEDLDVGLIIHWPEDSDGGGTLKDFMLFDVLMHEIGHHLLQHHKGKRLVRVARTRDHEAFADAFARQCREIYRASNPAGVTA